MRCVASYTASMRSEQAFKFFGSKAKTARALGVTRQAIAAWKEYPPLRSQLQIEQLTGGILLHTVPPIPSGQNVKRTLPNAQGGHLSSTDKPA